MIIRYWDVVWDAPGYSGTDWYVVRASACSCSFLVAFQSKWFLTLTIYLECRLIGSSFNIVVQTKNLVEVSFTNKWDSTAWKSSEKWRLPVNVDRR